MNNGGVVGVEDFFRDKVVVGRESEAVGRAGVALTNRSFKLILSINRKLWG